MTTAVLRGAGTTVYASGANGTSERCGNFFWTVPIAPVPVVLTEQTTLTIAAAVESAANTMKAAPLYNAQGNNVSYMTALKIA